MLDKYSSDLIELPGTSSGGVQLNDSQKYLNPLSLGEDLADFQVYFQGTVNSRSVELPFWFRASGAAAVKKIMGCTLFCGMPDAGIEEALKVVKEIYEFHIEPEGMLEISNQHLCLGSGEFEKTKEREQLVIE